MGTTEVTGTMLRSEPISTTGCGTVEGDYWDMPVNTVHAIADGGGGRYIDSPRGSTWRCGLLATVIPWQLVAFVQTHTGAVSD